MRFCARRSRRVRYFPGMMAMTRFMDDGNFSRESLWDQGGARRAQATGPTWSGSEPFSACNSLSPAGARPPSRALFS